MVRASAVDDLGKKPNCLSVRILLEFEMLEDRAMDDLFNRFSTDGLKRDGCIIGGSVRITRLKNKKNSR